MAEIINFKEKYVQTLSEDIKTAYDAADVISHQRKYRVPVELQELAEEYFGNNKSYQEFYDALPPLDEDLRNFLVVSYYMLWNYIYNINDKDNLYQTLEAHNIMPDDEWFVLEPELNRKIFHYLFPIQSLDLNKDHNQLKLI